MKKFLITSLAVLGFVLPSLAQVSHDYNPKDVEPVVTETITKDKVPAAVIKAVETQFDKNNPLTWSKFPFALKEYGWVYDEDASDIVLDRYEVTMKTDNDNELWAVYSSQGELIESREMSTNIPIPPSVMDAFNQSKYKDWKIIGNREIIKYYHDHKKSNVEQHFRITVEKDNVKRSISFNFQGTK